MCHASVSINQTITFNAPSVLFPDVAFLLPPVAHQVAADMEVCSALIAGHDMMPM